VLFDKLKPHGFWLAKNTVAFLRNSHINVGRQFVQIIAKRFGPTLEITKNAVAVSFLIM
jgi:hypothetical protein